MAYYFDLNRDDDGPMDSGYLVQADMTWGDNGPANGGDPELWVGDPSGGGSSGRTVWAGDAEPDGSTDTGWVPVELDVGAGSGDTLSVGGAFSDVAYTGQSYGDISEIFVEASVDLNAAVRWSDLHVDFKLGGAIVDTYSASSGPSVDTTTSSTLSATEVRRIVPASRADSAVITGMVRMSFDAGTYPGPSDLLAAVLVNSN